MTTAQEPAPADASTPSVANQDAPAAPSIKRLFKNASIYGIGQAIGSLIGFFTDPILSHLLTRADFGLLGLTRTTAGMLSSAYRLGLDGAANRAYYDVEGNEVAKRQAIGTINTFLIGWVLLLSLGQELFGPAIYSRAFEGLPYVPFGRFVAYTLACNTLMTVAQMVWGAQERAKFLASMRLGMIFLTNIIMFGLLLGPKLGVISIYIAQALSPTLLLWVHLRFAWGNFGFAWNTQALRRALEFGLPMVVHTTSHWALDAADRFLLDHYLGREAVGIYTVAYGTTSTLLTVNISINNAYVPQFMRTQGKPGGSSFVARSVTYLLLSVLAATLGFIIFAPFIIRVLYSSRFAPAAHLAPLLALVAPLHAVYLVYVNALFFAKKTRLIPVFTLITGLLNVGFNVLLIPHLQLLGAAIATVVSYAALAALFCIVATRVEPIEVEKDRLARVVVIFLVIAIAAYVADGRFSMGLDAAIKLTLAILAPVLLYASGFLTPQESQLVQNRLNSILRKKSV